MMKSLSGNFNFKRSVVHTIIKKTQFYALARSSLVYTCPKLCGKGYPDYSHVRLRMKWFICLQKEIVRR